MSATDLEIVVLPEADMAPEDKHHWACCHAIKTRDAGGRVFAFCGVELTDAPLAEGDLDPERDCSLCAKRIQTDCELCPQRLFGV